MYGDDRLTETFWRNVYPEPNTGCWLWGLSQSKKGYGQLTYQRKPWLAHRLTYLFLVGSIPEGLELDHRCRQRPCCNPDHLEPVTSAENTRRGAAVITHCPKRHPYDEDNTYTTSKGGRGCKKCNSHRVTAHQRTVQGSINHRKLNAEYRQRRREKEK